MKEGWGGRLQAALPGVENDLSMSGYHLDNGVWGSGVGTKKGVYRMVQMHGRGGRKAGIS